MTLVMARYAALLVLAFMLHPAAAQLGAQHPQVGPLPTIDPKYGEGCWVRFFDDADLDKPLAILPGGTYINSIAPPGLIGTMDEEDFFRRVRSVKVGREAKLIVYSERGFREELFALEPGTEVADLRTMGFPQKVASLKIVCER